MSTPGGEVPPPMPCTAEELDAYRPFAVVTSTVRGSPAWDDGNGFRDGDVITQFGEIVYCNYGGLEHIVEYVGRMVNKNIYANVFRLNRKDMWVPKSIRVKPTKWDHGIVLGMVINDFPIPVFRSSIDSDIQFKLPNVMGSPPVSRISTADIDVRVTRHIYGESDDRVVGSPSGKFSHKRIRATVLDASSPEFHSQAYPY